jgi:hypothetical protein
MVAKSRKNTSKKHRAVRKKILKTRTHKGGSLFNFGGDPEGNENPSDGSDENIVQHREEENATSTEGNGEEENATEGNGGEEGEGPVEGDKNEEGNGEKEEEEENEEGPAVEGGVFSRMLGMGGKKKGRKGKKKTAKKKTAKKKTKKAKRKTAKKKKGKK